jgi:hypothetical protein
MVIEMEELQTAEIQTIRQTYPQDWPAYNSAQTQEKLMSLDILGELCSYVPIENGKRGTGHAT